MAIIGIYITDITGDFGGLDDKGDPEEDFSAEVTWTAFSDDILDFPATIAQQGTITGNMVVDGKAVGWLEKGSSYQCGHDNLANCIAESVQVSGRKIIRGTGDYKIELTNGTVVIVPITPQGIVQYTVKQKFSQKPPEESSSSSDSSDGSDGGGDTPSNLEHSEISAETSFVEVPFVMDVRTGKPVINSAGQPFNPPATRQELVITLSVKTKASTYPDISLSGTVNTEPFLGAPAGTVLLESVTASIGATDKEWNVTRKYSFKPNGWATYILDTGMMEKTTAGLRSILDEESHAVQEPVKLDGHGHRLADQSSPGVLLGPFWGYR